MISRLVALFRQGGIAEVKRGIRDWYLCNCRPVLLSYLLQTATLQIGDREIVFSIENAECVYRSDGHDELDVMQDFLEHLEPDATVWDVGANQGSFTLIAAACGADTYAFEPGEDAREILEHNLVLNDARATVHPVALSDHTGECVLVESDRTGTRSISDEGIGDTIPAYRGDEIDAPNPDVIKIDVEGAEMQVLDGLKEKLSTTRLCYVEIHDIVDLEAVENVLSMYGFSIFEHLKAGEQTMIKAERIS